MFFFLIQLSVIVLFVLLNESILVVDAQRTLVWNDEFNSGTRPNDDYWGYDLGTNGDGWGNGELQSYTRNPENVRLENGNLKIIVTRTPPGNPGVDAAFRSARIKTQDKVSFRYGTVEARIRTPNVADGLWPAFWTLGSTIHTVGWPSSGEINIMEVGQGLAISEGVVNRRVVSAAHWEHEGTYASFAQWYDNDSNLNENYHTYRLEWTPLYLMTYIDNRLIWAMDISPEECTDCEELHQPHFLLFNVAVGGGFTSSTGSSSSSTSSGVGCGSSSSSSAGGPSTSSGSSGVGCGPRTPEDITAPLPAEMSVDWIRIYDNGYTDIVFPSPAPAPSCQINPRCNGLGLQGECCPASDGTFLSCCDVVLPPRPIPTPRPTPPRPRPTPRPTPRQPRPTPRPTVVAPRPTPRPTVVSPRQPPNPPPTPRPTVVSPRQPPNPPPTPPILPTPPTPPAPRQPTPRPTVPDRIVPVISRSRSKSGKGKGRGKGMMMGSSSYSASSRVYSRYGGYSRYSRSKAMMMMNMGSRSGGGDASLYYADPALARTAAHGQQDATVLAVSTLAAEDEEEEPEEEEPTVIQPRNSYVVARSSSSSVSSSVSSSSSSSNTECSIAASCVIIMSLFLSIVF